MTISILTAGYNECKAKASMGSVPADYYHNNEAERAKKEKKH